MRADSDSGRNRNTLGYGACANVLQRTSAPMLPRAASMIASGPENDSATSTVSAFN